MTWIRNSFFTPRATTADDPDPEAVAPIAGRDDPLEHAVSRISVATLKIREPSDKLTGFQIFYIFILHGIGSFIISGGINFAIAYGMYNAQDLEKNPIRLFELPNTLAGDCAVTIIVQCIITWVIELILVNHDLRHGYSRLQPIGFIPEPKNRFVRWFMFLDRTRERRKPSTLAHWAFFVYSQVLRGFLTAIPSFCLLWGPSVGILTSVGTKRGGDWYFEATWAPQVFKLLLGGILGLITTPLFALFWLVRCGWALKTNERHYGER